MNHKEHLIEQHVLRYQARLSHIDELVERVDRGDNLNDAAQLADELSHIRQEREALLSQINGLKSDYSEAWQQQNIEQSGPMIIWEAVANKLQKLINHTEH